MLDDLTMMDGEAQAVAAPRLTITDILSLIPTGENVAEYLTAEKLAEIGRTVVREYQIDKASRADLDDRMRDAMKLAKQVKEEKSYPWPKAANVKFPLMTTAAMQFGARALPAIVTPDPVLARVQGVDPDGVKRDRADRVSAFMSYQVMEQMDGWAEDTDKLLHALPVTGNAFRKTYWDPQLGKPCSTMIGMDCLYVNAKAKTIDTAPRVTEVFQRYPHEVTERQRTGLWLDVDIGAYDDADTQDDDAPRTFLEQHRLLDLDDDGYPEPYVVTVHEASEKVLRIVPRFEEEDVMVNRQGAVSMIKARHYYTHYGFIPDPEGGFYYLGFGSLLEPINEAINTTINQLLDAGHLANTQSGFIGLSQSAAAGLKGGTLRMGRPGELKSVQMAGNDLRNAIVMMDFKEPSAVLFNLLGLLIDAGRDIAAISEAMMGQGDQKATATTTLALIEQGQKVFSAIYMRIHRAMSSEFRKLYQINALYLNPIEQFRYHDLEQAVFQEDFRLGDLDIRPVSDPQEVTSTVRMARAQFLMGFLPDPFVNPLEIRRRIFEAASIPEVNALLVEPPPPPSDPKADADAMLKLAQAEKTETETVKAAVEIAAMGGPLLPQLGGMTDDAGSMGGLVGTPGNSGVPGTPVGLPEGIGSQSLSPLGGGGGGADRTAAGPFLGPTDLGAGPVAGF